MIKNNQYSLHRSIDLLAGFTGDADVVATQINTLPKLVLPSCNSLSKLNVVLALYDEGISGAVKTTPAFTYSIQPLHIIDTCSSNGAYQPIIARDATIASKNQWDVVNIANPSNLMVLRLTSITIAAQAAGVKLGVFVNYILN